MAIKVQGNIVIDDSQNIINIGVATIGSIDVNKISPDGSDFGASSYVPVADGAGTWSWQSVTSAGAGVLDGIIVQEEGSTVGTAGSITTLNFIGNNITATAVSGGAIATITASDTPTFDTLGIGTRIDLIPYDTLDNGTLSFEGSAGQLFSITNNLSSGSIFSVNDVSGIPSIDVDADGTIQLAPYGSTEYVGIGTTNPTAKLDVRGTLNVTGVSTFGGNINLGDDDRLRLGDSQDLQIYHQNSSGFSIIDGGSQLRLRGDGIRLQNSAGTENQIIGSLNGAVELYYDNAKKFETTSGGVTVTGTVTADGLSLGDNEYAYFGADNDLQIYHDGTDNYIDGHTGDLWIRSISPGDDVNIRSNDDLTLQTAAGTNAAVFIGGGEARLYHNGSIKFETTGYGVTVFGGLNVSGVSTISGNLYLNDTNYLSSQPTGDVGSVQINGAGKGSWEGYSIDGRSVFMHNGNDVTGLYNDVDNEWFVKSNHNAGTELYHDGSKRLETTSYGIYVTGTGNTSTIGGAANLVLDPSAVGDNTGTVTILGNLQVDGTQTVINSTTMTVDDLNITLADGAANASAANGAGITVDGASATLTYASTGDKWVFNKAPYYNTDRLLTTADEGTGNGIDADTVDGLHAGSFIRSDASDTFTGLLVQQAGAYSDNVTYGGRTFSAGVRLRSTSMRGGILVSNENDFRALDDHASFMVYDAYNTSSESYAFRASVGTTLADKYWVTTQGNAYFSGDVGIGTTNPTAKLDVNGTVSLGSSVYDTNGSFGTNGQVLSNVTGFGVSWVDAASGGGTQEYRTANAQYSMSGGGTVTFDGSNIKWSYRVILIPVEKTEFSSTGYIDINCPTSGTIPHYKSDNTLGTATCTSNGIPIAQWEGLWYRVSPGQNNVSVQSQFALVHYINSNWSPDEGWVLIATRNGDGTNGGHLKWLPGQINFPNDGGVYDSRYATSNWQDNITEGNTSAEVVDTGSDGHFKVTTEGTERLRVTSAGDVGIGTTNPTSTLTVQGTTRITGISTFSDGPVFIGAATSTGTASQPLQVSGGAYVSGNLGVGNTNPGAKLDVYGGSAYVRNIGGSSFIEVGAGQNSNQYAYIDFVGDTTYQDYGLRLIRNNGGANTNSDLTHRGTGGLYLTTQDAGFISLRTQNTDRVRVTSAGDVGIGTDNPSTKLDVRGHIKVDNGPTLEDDGGPLRVTTPSGYIRLGPANTTYCHIVTDRSKFYFNQKLIVDTGTIATYNEDLILQTDDTGGGTERLRIQTSNGYVGINTTTPQYQLEVNGSFAATTKSFVIDHPTKDGMKLRYGSLEGPENGVYVRGRLKGNNTIELPEHWTGLVDGETITVNLTPIGRKAPLHSVVDIADNTVVVESANDVVDCFYTVFGERKDVVKLEVEF